MLKGSSSAHMSKDTEANTDREHLHGPDTSDKSGRRNAQGVFITITADGNTEYLGRFNGNNGQNGFQPSISEFERKRESGSRLHSVCHPDVIY